VATVALQLVAEGRLTLDDSDAYNSEDASRQAMLMMNAGDSTMEHEDNGKLQDLLARAYWSGHGG